MTPADWDGGVLSEEDDSEDLGCGVGTSGGEVEALKNDDGESEQIDIFYVKIRGGVDVIDDGLDVEGKSLEVYTLYKRAADKVKPVDTAPSDGSVPEGNTDWKAKLWEKAQKKFIIDKDDPPEMSLVVPRFTDMAVGHRLTDERMKDLCKSLPEWLTMQEKGLFQRIMLNRESALAWTFDDIGKIDPEIIPPQKIRTIPHKAWQARSIPVPKGLRGEVAELLKAKIDNGLLERSHGPYRNPWFLVEKKNKKYRLINSATRMNAVTLRDAFTAPSIDEFVEDFVGQKLYTVADFFSGYDQISLSAESRDLTAFETAIGLLRSTTLPQGATNSVAQFQRSVVTLLDDLIPTVARAFVDDVVIRAPRSTYNDEEVFPGVRRFVAEHLQNIDRVLVNFELSGATAAAEKSQWCQESADLVGFTCTSEGRMPEQGKTYKITTWPECKNVKDVRSFVGLVVFYRLWIDHFAILARPLYRLLKKDAVFVWGPEQKDAFKALKQAITSPPVLISLDYNKGAGQIVLTVDASLTGWGAVLSQEVSGHRKPARFESGMWSDTETRYDATKRECRGVAYALRRLRSFLYGIHFILETDALVLVHQLNGALDDIPGSLLLRWVTWIRSFDFEVKHISGTKNAVADALSRRPEDVGAKEDGDKDDLENFIEAQIFLQDINPRHEDNLLIATEYWSAQSKALAIYLKHGDTPLGLNNKNAGRFVKRAERYELKDGILWLRPFAVPEGGDMMRVVDDPEKRRTLVREAHLEVGHRGRDATYGRLKTKYWWKGMSEMVASGVKACDNCSRWAATRPVDAAQYQTPPSAPFTKLYLDCQGMPTASGGGKFLIEARCGLTGYVEAAILTSLKSAGAMKFLRDSIVYRYGIPHEVVVDGGSEFKKEFREFCEKSKIKCTVTSAYNPKANGIVEAGHYPLVSSLAKLTDGTGRRWNEYLPLVLFADRTSVRKSHGRTPFYLVYGYEAVTQIESSTPTWRLINWDETMTPSELLEARVKALSSKKEEIVAVTEAVTEFRRKRASDRDYANRFRRRAGGDEIGVGDMVLVWDSVRAADMSYDTKLTYRWEGPYRVLRIGDVGNYQLAQLDGAILSRSFNRDHLKKIAKDENGIWQDVSEDSDDDVHEEDRSDKRTSEEDRPFGRLKDTIEILLPTRKRPASS